MAAPDSCKRHMVCASFTQAGHELAGRAFIVAVIADDAHSLPRSGELDDQRFRRINIMPPASIDRSIDVGSGTLTTRKLAELISFEGTGLKQMDARRKSLLPLSEETPKNRAQRLALFGVMDHRHNPQPSPSQGPV